MPIFRRHDSENSVTAAIVTTNDGHHDIPPPGYEGHEDQGGHNGSYRPVQMYSTVQSNSSDPATSQQTQVTPRRTRRREKLFFAMKR